MNTTTDKRVLAFASSLFTVALIGAFLLRDRSVAAETRGDPTRAAENAYTLRVSTAPAKSLLPAHRRHHPMKRFQARARQFRQAFRKASPNPKVQGSHPSPMPANSPEMPSMKAAPPPAPEDTGAQRFFKKVAGVMTKTWGDNIFVWLPAISTDPNAGPTFGILPVMVLADKNTHHIRHLLAPSYTYNDLFGQTETLRYYFYPTDSSQLYATGSVSQHENHELKGRYENTASWDGLIYTRTEVYTLADASQHFYGLGAGSLEKNESGYTARDTVARTSAGINFLDYWRATVGARYRHYETDENIIPSVEDIAERFPTVDGLKPLDTVATEARILWDTRDSPITPAHGQSGELFLEKTSAALGSDSDYVRYGMEGKQFINWDNPRQVTVLHGLYEWANGPNIPFYELPSLGGRETLRGYGDGRFVDRGRLVFNVEQRMTLASVSLMNIQTNFEVAPFVDLGSVFPTLPQIRSKNMRPVMGGAFRAAVKPNVVGDVEIGVGKEGPAVFVDINYPY